MSSAVLRLQGALRVRLFVLLAALVLSAVAALGATAVAAFDRAVEPELVKRTRLIGVIVRAELQRVLDLGIGLDAVSDLDRYLSDTISKFPEVDRISIATASGRIVADVLRGQHDSTFDRRVVQGRASDSRNAFLLPILDGNRVIGDMRIEISRLFVKTRLTDVLLDVLVIGLVATLVALELVLAVVVTSVGKPLDRVFRLLEEQRVGVFVHRIPRSGLGGLSRVAERLNDRASDLAERLAALPANPRARLLASLDARIVTGRPTLLKIPYVEDIRPALFVYSIAAEIAVSFLPLYARTVDRPAWLSTELAAASPLILYLCAMTLLAPFAGGWVRRLGARRLFLLSMPPTAVALLGLAGSDSLLEVTIWRGVMAICYAIATIACQEYAIGAGRNHGETKRGDARPVAASMAAIYGGVFCGSALGGVIAGRFGFAAAFATGAVLVLVAGGLAFVALQTAAERSAAVADATAADPSPVERHGWRYWALLIGAVGPMSATTAVFIWYLTPLMLSAEGAGPAAIGRVVMLYYLAVVLFGPAATAMSDGRVGPRALIAIGATASAAALLSLTVWGGFWATVTVVAVLGISHTLMRAPMYALAQHLAGSPGAGLGPLRFSERVGAMLGLGASALVLQHVGAQASIVALGVVVAVGLAFYAVTQAAPRHPRWT